MKKFLNKTFSIVFLIFSLIFTPIQGYALTNSIVINDVLAVSQNNIINYEKSQPSAIDNPVDDPNFNVMRSSDMNSTSASYFVVALIVLAAIVPVASWFFSRSKASQ